MHGHLNVKTDISVRSSKTFVNLKKRKEHSTFCDNAVIDMWSERLVRLVLGLLQHECVFLAPELFFLILAYPVYKMWIIHEQNKL